MMGALPEPTWKKNVISAPRRGPQKIKPPADPTTTWGPLMQRFLVEAGFSEAPFPKHPPMLHPEAGGFFDVPPKSAKSTSKL